MRGLASPFGSLDMRLYPSVGSTAVAKILLLARQYDDSCSVTKQRQCQQLLPLMGSCDQPHMRQVLVVCRTLSVPVTDIVRTGDKAVVPQEGLRKASGGKASLLYLAWSNLFIPMC